MTEREHNPSRRALLGAAVAVQLTSAVWVSGPPPPSFGRSPSPSRGGWALALARFEAAERAARALEGREGDSREAQFALEEAYGERLDAMYAALRRLLRAPASDLAALGRKVVLAVDHEVATLWRGEACMAALKRDALRLCAGRG